MDDQQLHDLLTKAINDKTRKYIQRFLGFIMTTEFNKPDDDDAPLVVQTPGDDTPVQTPSKPADDTPGKPADDTPVQAPEQTSVHTPGEPADDTPSQTPGKPADDMPAQTPGEPADDTPSQTPGKPADDTPVQTPEHTPGKYFNDAPDVVVHKKPINIIYNGRLNPVDVVLTKILENFPYDETYNYTISEQWIDSCSHRIVLKEFKVCECLRSYEYDLFGKFHREIIYIGDIPQRVYGVESSGYYIHEVGSRKEPYTYGIVYHYTFDHKLRKVSNGNLAVERREKSDVYIIVNLIDSLKPDSELAVVFINYIKNNKRDVLGFNMIA